MIRWFISGLAHRRLTSRYPREPERPPRDFRARVLLDPRGSESGRATVDSRSTQSRRARRCVEVCLPDALSLDDEGRLRLDAGRCIACGLCVEVWPGGPLALDGRYELGARSRSRLVVDGEAAAADVSPAPLGGAFRRSLHIRHVDTGSDGAVEQEIAALLNPYYDMHRLGLFFTPSPRYADVLLVTGPVTAPMEAPLRRAYEAMPEPRVVVAAGTDACSGGIWRGREVLGGVEKVLPVDVYIPGDPPSPIALLHGLLLARGRVQEAPRPVLERTTRESPTPVPERAG